METTVLESENFAPRLEQVGAMMLRYGLAIILIWIGGLKFTAYEAKGIEPLVMNSPFLSWAYHAFGVFGVARLLGTFEIIAGVLILLRAVNARLSAIGSMAAVLMFLVTLSLLFSTPGVIAAGHSFPVLSADVGQFIVKDLVLLGASIWTAGEAFLASRLQKRLP